MENKWIKLTKKENDILKNFFKDNDIFYSYNLFLNKMIMEETKNNKNIRCSFDPIKLQNGISIYNCIITFDKKNNNDYVNLNMYIRKSHYKKLFNYINNDYNKNKNKINNSSYIINKYKQLLINNIDLFNNMDIKILNNNKNSNNQIANQIINNKYSIEDINNTRYSYDNINKFIKSINNQKSYHIMMSDYADSDIMNSVVYIIDIINDSIIIRLTNNFYKKLLNIFNNYKTNRIYNNCCEIKFNIKDLNISFDKFIKCINAIY